MDNFGENLFILLFRASTAMMIFFVTLCLVLWLLKAFQVEGKSKDRKESGKY